MRPMRGLVGLVLIITLAGCQQQAPPPAQSSPSMAQSAAPAAPTQSPVERGKYLTTVGGCNDCHTPKKFGPNGPEPDMTKELSGHPAGDKFERPTTAMIMKNKWGTITNAHLTAWNGPWGTSFAMNLTSDKTTGIGSWTQEMFISAIRSVNSSTDNSDRSCPISWVTFFRRLSSSSMAMRFLRARRSLEAVASRMTAS